MISQTRMLFCASLFALAAGCGGPSEKDNQAAATANIQEPSDNGMAQPPSGPPQAEVQMNERRGETTPPVGREAGSRGDAARTAPQRSSEPRTQRNEASDRPAPRPAPAPAPTETCAPEHRAAGHC
jgi:hypothetical protein